jgi:hypothetical protein
MDWRFGFLDWIGSGWNGMDRTGLDRTGSERIGWDWVNDTIDCIYSIDYDYVPFAFCPFCVLQSVLVWFSFDLACPEFGFVLQAWSLALTLDLDMDFVFCAYTNTSK